MTKPKEKPSFLNKIVRAFEVLMLNPKLRFIKSQYGARAAINCGALLISITILSIFIAFVFYSMNNCVETKYISLEIDSKNSQKETTVCKSVPQTFSSSYFLGEDGEWSSKGDFIAKTSLFKTSFSEFSATQEEFDQYINQFDAAVMDMKSSMYSSSQSTNLKRLLTFMNGSIHDPLFTNLYINFDKLFKPDSATGYFTTGCANHFSPWEMAQLALDASAYSYDRRLLSSASTTQSGSTTEYSLTFSWVSSPYDLKTALDSKTDLYNAFGDAMDSSLNSTFLDSFAGVSDDTELRFETSMCPLGFSGSVSSSSLTCSISFDSSIFALVAALNSNFGTVDDELVAVTPYRYLSRRFASSDKIVMYNGQLHISLNSFLFLPAFDHWDDTCDDISSSCTTKRACKEQNYELTLQPIGVLYDDAENRSYPFVTPYNYTDCSLFAPFYLGLVSEEYTASCSIDETNGCYQTWTGDGYCDLVNNNDCCGWDGGDCCAETCVSSVYACGVNGFECCEKSDTCAATCDYGSDDRCYGWQNSNYNRRLLQAKSGNDDEEKMIRTHARSFDGSWLSKDVVLNMKQKRNEKLAGAKREKVEGVSRSSDAKILLSGKTDAMSQYLLRSSVHSQPKLDASRKLAYTYPTYYNVYDYSLRQTTFTASLDNVEIDSKDKFGYIRLEDLTNTFPSPSYMCYSRAVTEPVNLCSTLCSRYGNPSKPMTYTEGYDGRWRGFLASTQTMSSYENLGTILNTANSYVMPNSLRYDTGTTVENQTLYVSGMMAVVGATQTDASSSLLEFGTDYGKQLPCELAVCYCYEKYPSAAAYDFMMNIASDSSIINGQFYELSDIPQCIDPFRSSYAPPTDSPSPLLESYWDCSTVTCPDFLSVFGASLANTTTINDALMIIFIFFITQVYIKTCMGKGGVSSFVASDEDFELELRKLVQETYVARQSIDGGDIGNALVSVLKAEKKELSVTEDMEMSSVYPSGKKDKNFVKVVTVHNRPI